MAKGAGSNDTRADFAVKLVLFFFVSILSFSIGTYLGKQVSDADHRQAALETEYSVEKVAENKETYEDESVAPIEDEVVAKITDEAIAANRKVASTPDQEVAPDYAPADSHDSKSVHADQAGHMSPAAADHAAPTEPTSEAAPHEGYSHRGKAKAEAREEYTMNDHKPTTRGTAATPTEKKVQETLDDAGQRVASGMAPSADPKKVVTPSSALPTVATSAAGKYTVQVASYATTQEAEEYANQLKNKGHPAFVVPAEVGGKTWFRVSLGKFPDQNSAKTYLGELRASQTVTSAIVQKLIQ